MDVNAAGCSRRDGQPTGRDGSARPVGREIG